MDINVDQVNLTCSQIYIILYLKDVILFSDLGLKKLLIDINLVEKVLKRKRNGMKTFGFVHFSTFIQF